MEEHTLRVLEYDKIIACLRDQAACSLGRETAGLTYPATDLAAARRKQQETSEARAILQYEGNIPFGGIEDIRKHVERAIIGALLQPTDLLSVHNTLAASRRLGAFLTRLKEKYPILGGLGSEIEKFEKIEAEINQAISQAGEVLDSASPALARVRSELRAAHSRLSERMNQFLHARENRTIIQEPVITIRNDRYCIPIKAEYRGQFPGIVHDASTSGATVFIEPAAIVELGNRRKELVAKEREEIEKVLTKLSGLVGNSGERILATMNVVALLDCIAARAKLAIAQGATEPVLNDTSIVDLVEARHPLLTPSSSPLANGGQGGVVPINVTLGKRFSALLITGPNTGGKTVSLKTVGLLSLMAASGLQIPAAPGSELGVFDKVFADIGDEQSIEQSLSTFSSHMNNIVRITRQAGRNSLVLLDEIGAGTDPAEGAALAKAVLDHLVSRGARIVATTHHGELKEFAYLRDGIENACVEFDPETLKPTYRLMIGIPGSSNAFAIATRLGLSDAIVKQARSNLASHAEATEELIRRIEESHRIAAEERRIAERTSLDAEALRRRYQEQLSRLDDARDRVEIKAKQKAQSLIDSYTRRLDRTLEQLAALTLHSSPPGRGGGRGVRAQDLKKKAEKLIDRLEEQVVEPVQRREIKEEPLPPETQLVPGARVRIAGIDRDGEIVEPPEHGKVVVLMGTMRVSVALRDLRKPRQEKAPEEPVQRSVESAMAFEKAKDFSPELHLRGLRVEPGLVTVEKYLDDAMTAGIDRVRIVHGKGTGQMRSAVHQYLKSHPGVSSFHLAEPEEGGSGATVVEMKK